MISFAEQARVQLDELMDLTGTSARRLAKLAGVGTGTVNNARSGLNAPSVETYGKLMNGLGYSITLILTPTTESESADD